MTSLTLNNQLTYQSLTLRFYVTYLTLNNQLTYQLLTLIFYVTNLMLNNQLTHQWLTLVFYVTYLMLNNQLTYQWLTLVFYVTNVKESIDTSVASPGILCDWLDVISGLPWDFMRQSISGCSRTNISMFIYGYHANRIVIGRWDTKRFSIFNMTVCYLFWFVWTTACFWVWKNILKVHNLERVKLYTNPDLRMTGIDISVLKGCIFWLILFVCFNLVFVQNG